MAREYDADAGDAMAAASSSGNAGVAASWAAAIVSTGH